MSDVTRRDVLRVGIGAAAAGLIGISPESLLGGAPDSPKVVTSARKRVLRIAHLTDIHLQPELGAAKGLAACLHHVQSLKDKPDLILNGGDAIMDSLATQRDRTKLQWDLWNKVLKAECSLPIESCIGNHDVWGWYKGDSKCTGDEDLYGKKWVLDVLHLARPYRSFDRAGWHFVVLDSVFNFNDRYIGRLDDEQFHWLEDDLAKTPKDRPVLVLSHIPILSACVFYDGELEKEGTWNVPSAWMHIDSRRIKDLFRKHPNVKVCLSGHLHLIDRVDYNGVTYMCNGAVSGNWWKGDHQECDEGYAIVNLYSDGSFDREYIAYGWTPEE